MSPQRRTALVSVVAACVLIALKLGTGLATGSLGLISEAIHSGTDLVAALLTLFAVGVAGRPADKGHAYGHGKAEHLAALAEGGILVLASLYISYRALEVLVGSAEPSVNPTWYAFVVVLVVVIVIDASRLTVSRRAARRYRSPALASNALHFASDMAGSTAVLGGLLLARAGWLEGDAAAALFVALLVLIAAARLMRGNVDVLMDRGARRSRAGGPGGDRQARAERAAPAPAHAPGGRAPLRRRRHRSLAGRGRRAGPRRGRCGRSRGSERTSRATSSSTSSRSRARRRCASASTPLRSPSRVREVHNLRVVAVEGGLQVALHLKLPGDLTLETAHAVASQVEQAIGQAVPEVISVQTHLEPLREPGLGRAPEEADVESGSEVVTQIVMDRTGGPPRELRFLQTDEGSSRS